MNPEELEAARAEAIANMPLGLDEYATNQYLVDTGLWTEEEITAAYAQQREAEAQFDAEMRDSLLAIQEANADRFAEDVLISELIDGRIKNMALTQTELNAELLGNAAIHDSAIKYGLDTADIQGLSTIWGEDEVAIPKNVMSAQADTGRGDDIITSEAVNNTIKAGGGDDRLTVTSNADDSFHAGTHILDGGRGTDHYTVNLKGAESIIVDVSRQREDFNLNRDKTIIAGFEQGESLTLNFNPERMLIEGIDPETLSAGQLLAQANIRIAGDFPAGMSVDCKPVQDAGVQSCTITRNEGR